MDKKLIILVIASRGNSVIRHHNEELTTNPLDIYNKMIYLYWIPFIRYVEEYKKNVKIFLVFGNTDIDDLELYIPNNILKYDYPEKFPYILQKTLSALEHINNDYDYLLRTNLSTFFHIDNLLNIIDYNYDLMGWQLGNHALKKSFLSGTCMIYSKNMVNHIINNKHTLEQLPFTDDLELSKLYNKPIKNLYSQILLLEDAKEIDNNKQKYIDIINKNNIFMIRIKNTNRDADIDYLEFFTNYYYN
jgi:hypothetical protein